MSTPTNDTAMARRRLACLFSCIVLGLTLAPIGQNFRSRPDDGFPFSYYPMFSSKRGEKIRICHPVAISADGTVVNLHYKLAGRGGMNQVRREIQKRVRSGEAELLCRKISDRLSESMVNPRADSPQNVTHVAIVTDTFRLNEFFGGNLEPAQRTEEIRIPVQLPQLTSTKPSMKESP